jgi:hypothetical protein
MTTIDYSGGALNVLFAEIGSVSGRPTKFSDEECADVVILRRVRVGR